MSSELGSGLVTAAPSASRHEWPSSLLGRRELAVAALGAWLVLGVGLTDGGYFGRSTTAMTVAFAAIGGLGLVIAPARPITPAGITTGLAMTGLLVWVALSALWARPGADVWFETRRCLLYATALWALLIVVDAPRTRSLLVGLVCGIGGVAVVALGMRASAGAPVDPYYGSLLSQPVDYPNALGVLMAIGFVLTLGLLVREQRAGQLTRARCGAALATVLLLALALTASRGAAAALAAGLLAGVVLAPRGSRAVLTATGVLTVSVALVGWQSVTQLRAEGPTLALVATAVALVGAGIPTVITRLSRRGLALIVAALVALASITATLDPPSLTSSYRSAYWRAAAAETREHPVLGSGAGSYSLVWLDHRTVEATVRDAHSLYAETLAELGPVGVALVLALLCTPLAVGARRPRTDVNAATTAAFLVFVLHAGIDWDWEMPVVTLTALGCAAALLSRHRTLKPLSPSTKEVGACR